MDKLPFPAWEWKADCGPGCESLLTAPEASLLSSGAALSTIEDEEGASTYVAIAQFALTRLGGEEVWFSMFRIVRLSDGKTMGLLRLRPATAGDITSGLFFHREKATYIELSGGHGRHLRGAFDPLRKSWEWKSPFMDVDMGELYCARLDVEGEPPVLLEACPGGIFVRDQPGSNEVREVLDAGGAYAGSAWSYGEKAAWADIVYGEGISRIWTWTEKGGADRLAEVPNKVCQLTVSADRIVGVRGEGFCDSEIEKPILFYLPREGGERVEGPPLPKAMTRLRAFGDYAVLRMIDILHEDPEERKYILLVRLTDWKMRRFAERPGPHRTIHTRNMALDDEYLYMAEDYRPPGLEGAGTDRIRRYRLSAFEEIGEPFELPSGP